MNKVVFITGASRGIGLATAKRFIKEGWAVVGFYNQTAPSGVEGAAYFQVDVGSWSSIQAAFTQAFVKVGKINCLVNCAGVFGYKNLTQYDEELMDKVVGVNEKGTYLCTKWAVGKIKSGSIVNVSSTAAQVGSSDPVYAGTKAAILGFTKSMAKALAPQISQLISLSLLKKVALPQDIADSIYFLASDQASHITGACLDINGGYVLR